MTAPAQATKPVSRLGNVKRGRQGGARRYCFYGVESVGKTTLAAHSPKPIFIDLENGSSELDVARYTFENGRVVPDTFFDVMEAVDDLTYNEHEFETLVIDSLDRVEALIWDYCLERDSGRKSELNKTGRKLDSIESYGFGKGYNVALDEFRALLGKLERLRETRQMNIIFVGHAHVKMFKNPSGEDYDRYNLRAHHGIGGQTKEWVDVIGFCCFEEFGDKLEGEGKLARPKGFSTGRRLLKLEREAAFDAKSRISLPREMEMESTNPWAPFQAAIDQGKSEPKELLALIGKELERIGDDALTDKVRAACKGVVDPALLNRYRTELTTRTPKEEAPENNE